MVVGQSHPYQAIQMARTEPSGYYIHSFILFYFFFSKFRVRDIKNPVFLFGKRDLLYVITYLHANVDMEEKVHNMLKLIEEDGDSFIKRAEMYYKRRPELISAIEDTYRAFKALADRYDLLSKELQNANNTIATVFPEQVQLALEAEDDQSSVPPPKSLKNLHIKSANVPKVPKASMDSLKGFINTASKQFQHKKSYKPASKPKPRARPLPTSGLSKDESLLEINKVNKEILALQTIKEFCKSSYENGLKKFYEIENQIVEMQEKVIKLQDEYDIEGVIDDSEARTLMAETALKSCKDTLSSLQEKQQQSNEEAKDEFKKIEEAREQLEALRRDCSAELEGEEHPEEDEADDKSVKKNKGEDITSGFIQELNDIDTLTSEKSFDMGSSMALTVTQLAEKIDLLVNKVVNLETAVSSQTVLINTMRTESDELRSQIKQLETDKEKLSADARTLRMRIKELEEKLSRLEELNTNVEAHNIKLEANFAHCRCSLDHLSERLTNVKPDEEAEESDSSHTKHGKSKKKKEKKEKKDGEHKEHKLKKKKHKDKKKDKEKKEDVHIQEEDDNNLHKEEEDEEEEEEEEEIKDIKEVVPSPKESSNDQIQSLPSPKESSVDQNQSIPSPRDITSQKEEEKEEIKDQKEEEEIKDQKDTVEIQTAGDEGKEEDLTSSKTEEKQQHPEIPSVLRESEVSKPVRRSITFSGELTKERLNMDDRTKEGGKAQEDDSDLSWQQMLLNGAEDRDKILLREYTTILRNYKDVKRKLSDTEKKERDIQFDITMQMRELKQAIMKRDQEIQQLRHELSLLRGEKDMKKEGGDDHDPPTGKSESVDQSPKPESTVDESGKPESGTEDSEAEEKEEDIKLIFKVKNPGVSAVEERLRVEIDAILDENLDFWLRFSTAFHQVQKYKNEAQDLMEEIAKLRAKKKQEGGMTQQLKSEVRPIYKHLREIQTELTVWLEQRVCLKDELKRRFTSLCSIQEEITTALKEGVEEEEIRFSSHQAAKLQGEILSMKQENNKVREELQACLDHVSVLQLDIEKTLRQLNQEFSICTDQPQLQHAISRSKIPLRSFIFGTKVKKQRSLFNFMHANRKLHSVSALPSV